MKKLFIILVFVLLTNLCIPQDKIIWLNSTMHNPEIMQADMNGNNIQPLFNPDIIEPTSVRLDVKNNRMYWADRRLHCVKNSRFDGTDIELIFNESDSLKGQSTIALDLKNGKIYATDIISRKILRSNLNGTNKEVLPVSISRSPMSLVVDTLTNTLFVGEIEKISKINLNNFTISTLIDSNLEFVHGLAIDIVNNKLYWTNSYNGTGNDQIQRSDLDGSNIETLITAQNGLDMPIEINLDLISGKMYWTDINANTIRRANLDGSNIETILSSSDNIRAPYGINYNLDLNKVYWTELYRSLYSYDLNTSEVDTLVKSIYNSPNSFYYNNNDKCLYYSDSGSRMISRSNLEGTNTNHMLTESHVPSAVILDTVSSYMYWVVQYNRAIYRSNLDGSQIQQIITNPFSSIPYTLDICYSLNKLYWADFSDRICRSNLDGSQMEIINSNPISGYWISDIEIDNKNGKIYWNDFPPGNIFRSNLDGSQVDSITHNLDTLSRYTSIQIDEDESTLYWCDIDKNEIWKSNLDGSNQQLLISQQLDRPVYITLVKESVMNLVTENKPIPNSFTVYDNFPNPFNPNTTVKYYIPIHSNVEISIYNIKGQRIKKLINGKQSPGHKFIQWDGKDNSNLFVSSGVYFCEVKMNNQRIVKQLLLIK